MFNRPVARALRRNLRFKYPPRPQHLQPVHAEIGLGSIIIGGISAGALAYIYTKSSNPSILAPAPIPAVVPALDLKEATAKLSAEENQSTFAIGTGGSFYTVRLASNSPVEDNLSHGPARGIGKDPWYYWGVYDGHAGWATSAVLRESLIPYVSTHLNALPESSPLSKTVSAIKQAFTHLDDDIFAYARRAIAPNTSATFSESISALAPAIAGSCAIFSAYEPSTSTLHTACTGDSRAVLGRSKPNSTVHTCEPLSVDQNGFNPDEIKRLTELHPNEPEMINPKNGRLLGWALSRAFGDSRGKWTNAEQTTSFEQFWAQKSIEKNKTPPYFTAEPEVTSTTVGNGDFIILASDGLWDHITSEDAVECVSRWAAAVKQGKIDPSGPTKLPRSKFERRPAFEREDEDSRFITWRATPEHFVVEDSNAATHLVKNAFGGSRRALFCGVIGTYSPISRYVRDDVTVQVVFFGDIKK